MAAQTFKFSGEFEQVKESGEKKSGVLYHIDGGQNTFSLQGFPTDDLVSENSKKTGDKWFLFKTPSFAIAEILAGQLFNRRFCVNERNFCNISEPGSYWWMEGGDCYLKISFQGPSSDQSFPIGPLGDDVVAFRFFGQMENSFRRLLPVKEFSLTPGFFALSTPSPDHLVFKALNDLFMEGTLGLGNSFPSPTFSCYWDELAIIRCFWIQLENHLKI